MAPAASIWFEIWGSWIRVKKFYLSPGEFPSLCNVIYTQTFPYIKGQILVHYAHIILFFGKSHHFGTCFYQLYYLATPSTPCYPTTIPSQKSGESRHPYPQD